MSGIFSYSLLPAGGGDKFFFQMLGVVALIVASLCAFFLKEPTGGHGELEVHTLSTSQFFSRYAIAPLKGNSVHFNIQKKN